MKQNHSLHKALVYYDSVHVFFIAVGTGLQTARIRDDSDALKAKLIPNGEGGYVI